MISWNGNIFHVTGPSWGESTGNWWILTQRRVMQSFDVFLDECLNKRLSKQSRCQWFVKPCCSLWHHCKGNVFAFSMISQHWDNFGWGNSSSREIGTHLSYNVIIVMRKSIFCIIVSIYWLYILEMIILCSVYSVELCMILTHPSNAELCISISINCIYKHAMRLHEKICRFKLSYR